MADPARSDPTTLLYIGGTSRSGSTVLECMLAELDNVVVLGEVAHLWQRGLVENQLCACREPFHTCPFWSEVGQRAFGGWDNVDVPRVLTLMEAVDRQRRLLHTARRHPPRAVAAAADEYSEYYRLIYDAARAVTGAEVVVDSSKVPPTGLAISFNKRLDLRVLHIVRDSRGVAYSWTKSVVRPETATGEDMPRLRIRKSIGLWLSHNLTMNAFRYRGFPLTRIRYEDLVVEPAKTVREAWRALDLPGAGELPMIDQTTIELQNTHSVAGNPMRFALGTTTLRPDVAWCTEMSARDRRVVTALTYPLLRAFGYR